MSVASDALCTRDDVKGFLGITSSKAEDNELIDNLIDRITDRFESYCRRKFKAADYTEYLSPHSGDDKLFIKHFPVNSVTSIYEDSDRVYASGDLIDSDDYAIVDDVYVQLDGYAFAGGLRSIKITYNAGYSTIPEDLAQACIEEVARRFQRRKQADVLSVNMADGTRTMYSGDFLPQVKAVLDSYKKRLV